VLYDNARAAAKQRESERVSSFMSCCCETPTYWGSSLVELEHETLLVWAESNLRLRVMLLFPSGMLN